MLEHEPPLVLVTITSDRPEAFLLCERWMSRQSHDDYTWIVVDDGENPISPSMGQTYIRSEPSKTNVESFLSNMRIAMQSLPNCFAVAFIEDDVYYSPQYLEIMINKIREGNTIVGSARCRGYNVLTGDIFIWANKTHSSLCQTMIHSRIVEQFSSIVSNANKVIVDMYLWNDIPTAYPRFLFPENSVSINMKCMPGKTGFIGHHCDGDDDDTDFKILRSWIGDDCNEYVKFRQAISS